MTYSISIDTEQTRDLVVSALQSVRDHSIAEALSGSSDIAQARRAGEDPRTAALRITLLLSEANEIGAVAQALAEAPAIPPRAVLDGDVSP
ncbi:MAG: hypothetical protein OSB43_21790 [Nocardioides sp.]|uniref:hypothetical protein n=1 Tax=Nocardioides sp. TaxID=35761 RepID=UPI0023958362|nr:hypothetical protein [Nocardioides sp.]MDE0778923.1 hypothetical protein [Nocardioides sp.]